MLRIIGLGLVDDDLTVRGRDALADADEAYAELYTNSMEYDIDALARETGTEITVLDRDAVEEADTPLTRAREQDVAFLVSGDPLTATTHQDILFRAREEGIETEVYHAPSILTAVAETGLSIYKFGRTTTLPEPYNGTVPDSPFDVIAANREQGLHTLVLLDIGMTVADAASLIADRVEGDVLACARLGAADRQMVVDDLDALRAVSMPVPAALIVPGTLSDNERERLQKL